MRVLLISANTEQITMPVLPMGLACVAAAVEKAGHEVKLLNLMTKDSGTILIEDGVKGFNPELIGISVRNIDDQSMQSPRFLLDAVKDVVASCRTLTKAPIVLGGAGYSIFPQSALAYLKADMGIQGEGESSLTVLLEKMSRDQDCSDVPGLVLPDSFGGKKQSCKLDDFPLPIPGGLLSFPTKFKNQRIWLPFQTRRGCPMGCSYCSTAAIEGRILRKRSPGKVVESIDRFVEAGFNHFFFVDNTFNFPRAYASALCDLFLERKLPIQWQAILYPWKVDERLIEKMAAAGCVDVAFGFESGSKQILRSMNKRFEPDEVRRISGILKKHGIGRNGFLLLGGPGETMQTVQESLEFADSLDPESMKITAGIRIYPHTALARTAVAEGVISPENDLLHPTFYLAKGLESRLQQVLSECFKNRPNWHP